MPYRNDYPDDNERCDLTSPSQFSSRKETELQSLRSEKRKLLADLDKVTAFLCALCKVTRPTTIQQIDKLEDWWNKHKEFDKERAEYERLKKKFGDK